MARLLMKYSIIMMMMFGLEEVSIHANDTGETNEMASPEIKEFSSTVMIAHYDRSYKQVKIVCTGTVITPIHVLTLASCVRKTSEKLYVLGGYDTLRSNGHYEILSVIRYNEWTRTRSQVKEEYNVAIMTLSKPDGDTRIQPVGISPTTIQSWHAVKGYVIQNRPSNDGEKLHKIDVKILPKPMCIGHAQTEDIELGKVFCTESPPGLVDGDKGGPLFNLNGQLFAINLKEDCQVHGRNRECTNLHINYHFFKKFIMANVGKQSIIFPSSASHLPLHAK